ncbi:hypothetical protein ABIC50_002594 [Burkholderia sp. 567]
MSVSQVIAEGTTGGTIRCRGRGRVGAMVCSFSHTSGRCRFSARNASDTLVVERDAYGDGQHRWHAGLLDLAKRYGFLPRLCRLYRAQTKGKVERFHRYLRGNFYVPLASQLKQSSLMLDAVTANVEVSKWLRDVANQRVHPVTGLAPAILLEQRERACLRNMPGYAVLRLPARAVARPRVDPAMSIRHPLSVYQQLLTVVRA